jgi:photosystem II stability/assembly factor-like uncharacterized protein
MKPVLLSILVFLLSLSVFAQWSEQTSGITSALNSVSAVNSNIAWASGASGRVLRTTNGGTTWTSVGGGAIGTSAVHNVFAWDANTAWVTANPTAGGYAYKTTDGGATWTQTFFQSGGFMNATWMISPTHGFMTGDPIGGRWSNWKTTDGGVTWDSTGMFLAQVGTEAGWNNSLFVSGSHIWFGTNNTRIYHSSDFGGTWEAQPTTGQLNSYAVYFNGSKGMAGGTQLVYTTNSGTNWTSVTSLGTANISGIVGAMDQWYFIRQSTAIYGSTNNGTTWTQVHTAPAGSYYHIAAARNGEDVAWAVRSNGGISKGVNLGLPVELLSFTASANYNNVVLEWSTATEINNKGFDVQRKVSGGEFESIAFINGKGTTTEKQDYQFVDKNLSLGNYTYRLKQIDFDGTFNFLNEVNIDVNVPAAFSLSQNYPNPFNPATKINFTLAEDSKVSLKFFNLLGEEVASVNFNLQAGVHTYNFDGSRLNSGVYFYKLKSEGINGEKFSAIRKMTLLK